MLEEQKPVCLLNARTYKDIKFWQCMVCLFSTNFVVLELLFGVQRLWHSQAKHTDEGELASQMCLILIPLEECGLKQL